MSTELLILIATSAAATVIIVALVLTKLVRTVAANASARVPDASRVRRRLGRRFSRAWRTVHPVREARVRPARSLRAAEGQILPARKEHAVPAGKELLRSADDKRAVPAAEKPAGSASEEPRPEFPAKLLAPNVPPGRSIDVKFRQSKVERSERRASEIAERQTGRGESVEGDSPAYHQVGEEVTAVLTAAEHAAAQIREAALQQAERTRLDADEKAAAALAEVQARRAEADSYSEETRAAADAYAVETRRNSEEQAAKSVSQAEERARQIRAQAEQTASDLQAEALRRRDDLAKGAEAMEVRIESMRTVFRGVVTELEELLPADRRGADEPEPRADERLDEALKPGSPRF
jgi:hypothetical protein